MDVIKFIEWLEKHPGLAWMPLMAIVIAVVLAYKVAETLLPQIVKALFGDLRAGVKARRARAQVEAAMRRLCETTRDVNWVGSLPALVQFNFDVPLTQVFVPPRLKVAVDGRAAHAVTFQEFLAENRIACITGAPGSGKSTLLGVAAIAFARETTEEVLGIGESRIPICFDFKDIDTEGELPAAPELFSALYKRHSLDVEPAHILKLLEEGRCAIFLDGLDEAGAAPQRRKLLSWLMGVGGSFSDKNRILITCRDTEWEGGSQPKIRRAGVLPFATQDARQFIAKWRAKLSQSPPGATARAAAVDARFDALSAELEGDYEFLASNPMLLTLGAVLLSIEIPLPRGKGHILETFVAAMLGDWETLNNKGAKRSAVQAAGKILQELAFAALSRQDEGGFVSIDDPAVRRIMAAIETASGVSPVEWLDLIAMRSGLLQKAGPERWDFSNRRILEFLAARELVARRTTWQAYWKDPAWKEVLLFVAEMEAASAKHLGWLEAQGAPDTDLHALLLLVSAIECRELQPARYATAMSSVHVYVVGRARQRRWVDEDLLWRYLRENSGAFLRDLAAEWAGERGASPTEAFHLTEMALRSGYSPIVKHVDENFRGLPEPVQASILQVLPDLKIQARALLLEGIFSAALAGAIRPSDLWDSLSRCGDDALDFLIRKVPPDRWTAEGALAARSIAVFQDARAMTFIRIRLTKGGADGLAVDAEVLIRHLDVIRSGVSGGEFGELLFGNDSIYVRFGKRILDIIVSFAALVFLMPLMVLVGVLVKVDSRGPIMFKLKMIGRELMPYRQVKYRTMKILEDEIRGVNTARSDPRITRIGSFLRRSSIDILPNIMNVFHGDMSLVGPRPIPFDSINLLNESEIAIRRKLKPGLTGYSQLNSFGRGSFSKNDEVSFDIEYSQNCGFWLDVKALLLTIPAVLLRKGAY